MLERKQLELRLDKRTARASRMERQLLKERRQQRAQWWFKQMRRVVDLAMAWQPAPPARPEQVYMALGPRECRMLGE